MKEKEFKLLQLGRRDTRGVQVLGKFAQQYSVPHPAHDVKVVLQVMSGCKRRVQNFARLKHVTQVGPRIVSTSVTGASRIKRGWIILIAGVLDNDPVLRSK